MKINPKKLREFVDDIDELKHDYHELVKVEPELLKHLDNARDVAKQRYDQVSERPRQ